MGMPGAIRVVAAVLLAWLPAAGQAEQDCNGNGVADGLEVERLFAPAGVQTGLDLTAEDIAVGDFDGDGDLDVFALGDSSWEIRHFDGAGFTAGSGGSAGPGARRVAVADFDGDGWLDVMYFTRASDAVLLLNRSGNGFEEADRSVVPSVGADIAVGDVTGDGLPDVVLPSLQEPGLYLLVNEGGGRFVATVPDEAFPPSTSAAIVDFDQEPGGEIVVADGSSRVEVYRWRSFGIDRIDWFETGLAASLVRVADLDGDLRPDLVVGAGIHAAQTKVLFDVASPRPAVVPLSTTSGALAVGDIDGDGMLDVLQARNAESGLSVNRGVAGRAFESARQAFPDGVVRWIVADVDGDAIDDLLVARARDITLLPGSPAGLAAPFSKSVRGFGLPRPMRIDFADMDGDSNEDLIVYRDAVTATLYLADGFGFGEAVTLKITKDLQTHVRRWEAADLDGDARSEFVLSEQDETWIYRFERPDRFERIAVLDFSLGATPHFADVSGDELPDLLTSSAVFGSLGGFAFAEPMAIERPTGAHVRSADVDGDGLADLVFADNTDHHDPGVLIVRRGLPGGGFARAEISPNAAGPFVLTDVTGDGLVDIVATRRATWTFEEPALVVLEGPDARPVGAPLPIGFGPQVLEAVDVDGDGRQEIIALPERGSARLFRVAGPGFLSPSWSISYFGDLASSVALQRIGGETPSRRLAVLHPSQEQVLFFPIASRSGASDCDGNLVPDECELVKDDCDGNEVVDRCERDSDGDGVTDACDLCPGRDDNADSDGDGIPGCADQCAFDAAKSVPMHCGCGLPEGDGDGDGVPDCVDGCPDQPGGATDRDGDRAGDACDECPDDPAKVRAGVCGCGVSDRDRDLDGRPDCVDACPTDPGRYETSLCGCFRTDVEPRDVDGDGVRNCEDNCPHRANETQADADRDGIGDACDLSSGPDCRADCNRDYRVAADEIERIAKAIFGHFPAESCGEFFRNDADRDGHIRANDVIVGIAGAPHCFPRVPDEGPLDGTERVFTHEANVGYAASLVSCGHRNGGIVAWRSEGEFAVQPVDASVQPNGLPIPIPTISSPDLGSLSAACGAEGSFAIGWKERGKGYLRFFDSVARTLGVVDLPSMHLLLALGDAGYVAIWKQDRIDGVGLPTRFHGTFFDSVGRPVSDVWRLPPDAQCSEGPFAAAADGPEHLVAVCGVNLWRFDRNGFVVGPSAPLSSTLRSRLDIDEAQVAVDPDTGSIAVWWRPHDRPGDLMVRTYNRGFTPTGSESLIGAGSNRSAPRLVAVGGDEFVAVWWMGPDATHESFVRRFSARTPVPGPQVRLDRIHAPLAPPTASVIGEDVSFFWVGGFVEPFPVRLVVTTGLLLDDTVHEREVGGPVSDAEWRM
jgi:hypothetical protein